jgi:hypothetical protein
MTKGSFASRIRHQEGLFAQPAGGRGVVEIGQPGRAVRCARRRRVGRPNRAQAHGSSDFNEGTRDLVAGMLAAHHIILLGTDSPALLWRIIHAFAAADRQTQILDMPVWRTITGSDVLSALRSRMAARQLCFCEALRSPVIASSRRRSGVVSSADRHARRRKESLKATRYFPSLHASRNLRIGCRLNAFDTMPLCQSSLGGRLLEIKTVIAASLPSVKTSASSRIGVHQCANIT